MAEKVKREKKNSRGCLIALAILLVLIFASVAALYCVFQYYVGKTNYVEIDPNASIELNTEDYTEETVTGTNSPDDIIEDMNQELENNINGENESDDGTGQESITDVAGVEHILLIGSDRRDQSWNGNSDSMILITINHKTDKIIMTSLMRDTYVSIPGVGNARLNNAYARGGAALLLETVRQNYKINVTKYAIVDFSAFTNVINVIGTIPMTLNDAEIAYLGKTLDGLQHEGNLYYLNGEAALSFARIRYVGKYDFERTERQRRVLTEVLNKMKSMDLTQLNSMANAVLPYVTHNITNTEILSYIAQSPQLFNYQLVSNRLPYDGMYSNEVVNGQQVLGLYWEQNRAQLNKVLYE